MGQRRAHTKHSDGVVCTNILDIEKNKLSSDPTPTAIYLSQHIDIDKFVKLYKENVQEKKFYFSWLEKNKKTGEETLCHLDFIFNSATETCLRYLLDMINIYYIDKNINEKIYIKRKYIAYMLATAQNEAHDTSCNQNTYFIPCAEMGGYDYCEWKYGSIPNNNPHTKSGYPKKLEHAAKPYNAMRANSNGNIHAGDGYKYRGRGYVQLTWHDNYKRTGEYYHVDLVNNPDLVTSDPELAARIMIDGMLHGRFSGKKLSDYLLKDGASFDYIHARHIINGRDRASLFAHSAKIMEEILYEALQWKVVSVKK